MVWPSPCVTSRHRSAKGVGCGAPTLVDDLTRLYNRRGFITLAEQQLRIARRQGKDAVVMYAAMDDFKQINDTHGHAVGDRVLAAVARLLQDTVRDCDVVGRLGGDEFTVLALDADGAGARAIQRRVDERLAVLNASGGVSGSRRTHGGLHACSPDGYRRNFRTARPCRSVVVSAQAPPSSHPDEW